MVECNGDLSTSTRGQVLEVISKVEAYLVLTCTPTETIICSGTEFQVHVWGLEKHVLWRLPPGRNLCITLRDVFLDTCDRRIYAVSSTPNACNELVLTECEKKLVELASRLDMPIFVLLNTRIPEVLPVNVVPHGAEDSCYTKLREIENLLKEPAERGEAICS